MYENSDLVAKFFASVKAATLPNSARVRHNQSLMHVLLPGSKNNQHYH